MDKTPSVERGPVEGNAYSPEDAFERARRRVQGDAIIFRLKIIFSPNVVLVIDTPSSLKKRGDPEGAFSVKGRVIACSKEGLTLGIHSPIELKDSGKERTENATFSWEQIFSCDIVEGK